MSYMKVEFDRILREYGHRAYLQRRTANTGNEANDYSCKFEIHLCRYRLVGALTATEEPQGQVNTSSRTYYFKSEALPWDNDRIWEQDNTDPNDRYYPWTVWEINGIVPMRGVGGQVEYYTATATRILPN